MGPTNSHTNFWPGPAPPTPAHWLLSFGITVLEAKNLRSSKVVNMGIYGLVLTHWLQNGIKHQNRTKNGELLLHRHLQFWWSEKIDEAYVVKIRHFSSDFDVLYRFVITESREVRRYPYQAHLVTSNFRPPVLWGQNFRANGLEWAGLGRAKNLCGS